MSDLLTICVNVPVEREKQRRIVNEMRAQIAERKQLTTLRNIRGFQQGKSEGRRVGASGAHGQHRPAGVEGVRMAPSQRDEHTPERAVGRN